MLSDFNRKMLNRASSSAGICCSTAPPFNSTMGSAGARSARGGHSPRQRGGCFLFHVERRLRQRLRIPSLPRDGKEIAAIDVDGASQAWDRVGYRMDDVAAQRLGVANAERPRPTASILVGPGAPSIRRQNMLSSAPGVNSDHRPTCGVHAA